MASAEQLRQIGLSTNEVSQEARRLLTADFYWSPIDDFSPFGNITRISASDVFFNIELRL